MTGPGKRLERLTFRIRLPAFSQARLCLVKRAEIDCQKFLEAEFIPLHGLTGVDIHFLL